MTDDVLVSRLRAAGCVAAEDEALELRAVARDEPHLDEMVARRISGEPLAWVTRRTRFCGIDLAVEPGLYVPRWQSERVAEAAAERLPARGVAVDLCCGVGAIAAVLLARRPGATVVGVDVDPHAVDCARSNGVGAFVGDLFGGAPDSLRATVDVVVAVPPYVPTSALQTLARTPEPAIALDGGRAGLAVIRRIVSEAPSWMREGGSLVLELGRPQVVTVSAELAAAGFVDLVALHDPDGDVCGISARLPVL